MNADNIVRIPIAEFRATGYLQEVNRRILHPLGLALEVVVNDDGTERLGGVWDYRDDPEGIRYGTDPKDSPDVIKAVTIDAALDNRAPARRAALGFVIQPVEDARNLDDEATLAGVIRHYLDPKAGDGDITVGLRRYGTDGGALIVNGRINLETEEVDALERAGAEVIPEP